MALTNESTIFLIFLKILKNKVLVLLTSTGIYSEYSSAHQVSQEFASTLLWYTHQEQLFTFSFYLPFLKLACTNQRDSECVKLNTA